MENHVQELLDVSKGGKTVLICDAHCAQARKYCHTHKFYTKPDKWTASGMVETRILLESFVSMVDGTCTSCMVGL